MGYETTFAHASDHIEVDHRSDLCERITRVANKKGGAKESAFFTREGDKQEAAGLWAFCEKASEREKCGCARSIVICAGVDLAEVSGESANVTITDVIVMCAEDEDLLFVLGVCSRQERKNIFEGALLACEFDAKGDAGIEWVAVWLARAFDLVDDILELLGALGKKLLCEGALDVESKDPSIREAACERDGGEGGRLFLFGIGRIDDQSSDSALCSSDQQLVTKLGIEVFAFAKGRVRGICPTRQAAKNQYDLSLYIEVCVFIKSLFWGLDAVAHKDNRFGRRCASA